MAALWADWLVLMSGIASVILAFWAAFFPPTNIQAGRTILWVASVACFAIASYRIWAKERDAREQEIGRLKTQHKTHTEQIESQHGSKLIDIIDGDVRVAINQENKHRAVVESLKSEIDSLNATIAQLTQHKLKFEIDASRAKVTVAYDNSDNAYSVSLHLFICFRNSDEHPLIVYSVSALLIKKNEDGTESEIPNIEHELNQVVYDETHNSQWKLTSWSSMNLRISERGTTEYKALRGHIIVSGKYRELFNANCFLRVSMEAMNQPPYWRDFNVDWEGFGWMDITPRPRTMDITPRT